MGNAYAIRTFSLCLASFVLLDLAPAQEVDLAELYAGSLDYEEGVGAVDWTSRPEDVFALKTFSFQLKDQLEFTTGPASVVFGKHSEADAEGRPQQSAVWAAVLPEEPVPLTSSEVGHGNHATAIFLRFHPSRVGELFPAESVLGPGDPLALVQGKQLYGYKINASWQWDNMPVVPWRKSLVLDMETIEGKRRFYMVDSEEGSLKYEPAFEGRTLPEDPGDSVGPKDAERIFLEAWKAFDSEYAMFSVKPSVDWEGLRDEYLPLARRAGSYRQLAGVLGLLVSELEDLHVHVQQAGAWIPTFRRFRVTNGNWRAVKGQLQGLQEKQGVAHGRIGDLGYIVVWSLAGDTLGRNFDVALGELRETKGLILDLRFNGGGNENLGKRIAGRFLDEPVVYSKSQYRNGSEHDDLTEALERSCEPRGPWRYESPVVVLQGEKTMSSAESLVLMLAQGQGVTTMGDRTAGSSANPRRLELDGNIVINLPRWLDLDPEGKPIDRVGVAPGVQVAATRPGDFRSADPVFEAALRYLKD